MIGVIVFPWGNPMNVSSVTSDDVPAISYLKEAGARVIYLIALEDNCDRRHDGTPINSSNDDDVHIEVVDFDPCDLISLIKYIGKTIIPQVEQDNIDNDIDLGNLVCIIDAAYEVTPNSRIANHIKSYFKDASSGNCSLIYTKRNTEFPVQRLDNPDECGEYPLLFLVINRDAIVKTMDMETGDTNLYSRNRKLLSLIHCKKKYEPNAR